MLIMAKPAKASSYHHGDLRRAILDAGEAELTERGLAGFSLRRVAARVGVSHAAPAHHFGDTAGMIAALAERGFRRLLACMQARQAEAAPTPYERLMGSGMGYLDFAFGHPALFRLVFGLPNAPKPQTDLAEAADAAFLHLARAVAALQDAEPLAHPGAQEEVLACWTRVHGLAELALSGYIPLPTDDPQSPEARAARDGLFRRLFEVRLSPG
jgi:AcrR family transcriptional regulator